MKIVYISNSVIPSRLANSIHIMKMCQAFARCGHEVVLLAPDRKDIGLTEGVADIYEYYGVERSFRIVKLPWLPIRGRELAYGLMGALKARSLSPDLIYSRFLLGSYCSLLLRMPVVFESHQPVSDANLFGKMIRSDNLRHLVVITESLKKHYQDNYPLRNGQIIVAPDAADEPEDRVLEKVEMGNAGRLQVGYTGHLYAGRGIEVIAELAERCARADFHIVGGMEEDIARWRNELRDVRNIRFHGFVPHGQLGRYLRACDVLLAPYQRKVSVLGGGDTAKWMSPMKLFEYMAAGKPIICSDLPVLREVLEDGKTALLCPPDDVGRWEAALCSLQENVSLRAQLGKNAREEFLQKYTWEARVRNVVKQLTH